MKREIYILGHLCMLIAVVFAAYDVIYAESPAKILRELLEFVVIFGAWLWVIVLVLRKTL